MTNYKEKRTCMDWESFEHNTFKNFSGVKKFNHLNFGDDKKLYRTSSEDSLLHPGNAARTFSSHHLDSSSISWSTPLLDKDVALDVLFGAFVDCHQRQLKYIEKTGWDQDTKLKEKVKVLESYVNQLEEQNDVLINTASELERQTKKRVTLMEKRLKSSANTTKEFVLHLQEYEEHCRNAVVEKSHFENAFEDLTRQHSTLKVENGFLRDQNENLRHDLQSLLHIIQQARSTGHWEFDCVTFCELTPNQVFGQISSYSTHQSRDSLTFSDLHYVQEDLKSRGCTISERGSLIPSHHGSFSALQDIEILPNGGEENIGMLKNQMTFLQNLREQAQIELIEKDKTVANLETQITKLNYELHIQNIDFERRLLDLKLNGLQNSMINHDGNLAMNSLPCVCTNQNPSSSKLVDSLEWGINTVSQPQLSLTDEKIQRNVDLATQTEFQSCVIPTQTEDVKKELKDIINCPIQSLSESDFTRLKELLRKAEDKASAKEMLVTQLQSHLQTSSKEVELKDTVLKNLENKLDASRKECVLIKDKLNTADVDNLSLKEDIEVGKQRCLNLQKNVDAREEQIEDLKTQQDILQEQKRTLMIQCDEQAEQLTSYEEQLLILKNRLEINDAEVELQKITIQNLQEALVKSKGVKTEWKVNGQEEIVPGLLIARRALSQSSIYEI